MFWLECSGSEVVISRTCEDCAVDAAHNVSHKSPRAGYVNLACCGILIVDLVVLERLACKELSIFQLPNLIALRDALEDSDVARGYLNVTQRTNADRDANAISVNNSFHAALL